MITATSGTASPLIAMMSSAMAAPWPRSSASMPGYAPDVSTSVTTGRPNFWAWRMRRSALR